MTEFFRTDPIAAERLLTEARTWIKTPFMAHACVKGGGVDCVHLVAALYRAVGLIEAFSMPRYDVAAGHHLNRSQLKRSIESLGCFVQVGRQFSVGDLLCFRVGKVDHHVGIALDGKEFIHSIEGRGVCVSIIADSTWSKRLTAVYRPVEADES